MRKLRASNARVHRTKTLEGRLQDLLRKLGLAPPPAGIALRRTIRFDAARRARVAQRASRRRGDA